MPEIVFLAQARYLSEKHKVLIEFSSESKKFSQCFEFFPSLLVSVNKFSEKRFFDSLKLCDSKKVIVEKLENNSIKLTASDFEKLKNLEEFFSSMGFPVLLLSAERQFLIQKNWSFFDAFRIEKEELQKLDEFIVPNIELDFLGSNLVPSLKKLLFSEKDLAKKLIESIVLSNILTLSFAEIPKQREQLMDAFFEKIFFQHAFLPPKNHKFLPKPFNPRNFTELKEMDFSSVFSTLLTFPFFNLGFDSINCECCKPENFLEKNVLPNSLIEVGFLNDGTYFQSNFDGWAQAYHLSHPLKEKRLKRKKEWFLPAIPCGPFLSGQTQKIPLIDCVQLLESNKIKVLEHHLLQWFCIKKESLLSKTIIELNQQIIFLDKKIDLIEKEAAKEFALFSRNYLDSNLNYLFLIQLNQSINSLLEGIPKQLIDENSKFFSSDLGNAVECIKAKLSTEFSEFASKKGTRCIAVSNKALVEGNATSLLLKQFSLTKKPRQ